MKLGDGLESKSWLERQKLKALLVAAVCDVIVMCVRVMGVLVFLLYVREEAIGCDASTTRTPRWGPPRRAKNRRADDSFFDE